MKKKKRGFQGLSTIMRNDLMSIGLFLMFMAKKERAFTQLCRD